MKTKHLIMLFILVVILELLGGYIYEINEAPYGIWIFKPLLMPILMFWYYKETKIKTSFDKIILASLFFSWWGDNFLMPAIFKTDINFLLGLASFLVAHLLYIAAFTKIKPLPNKKSILINKPYLVIPFILLIVGLLAFLIQENNKSFIEMKMPVIVYASIIMIMVVMALNRKGRVNNNSFQLVFIGALLFMISDSVIALSRFSSLFQGKEILAGILIMVLYAMGQYLIVKGAIAQQRELAT